MSAARSAEERALIGAILERFLDPAPRDAYASWLDGHGDARAAEVRALTAAISSLSAQTTLPELPHGATPWGQLLGARLLPALVERGLTGVATHVCALLRPCVWITTTQLGEDEQPWRGGSRFGGLPDLAPEADWPSCAEGRLGFAAQLDLAALSLLQATRALPEAGLLSLFVFEGDGVQPGFQMLPGDVQLRYTAATETLAARDAPDDLSDYNQVRAACRVTLADGLDLPNISWEAERLDEADRVDPERQADLEALLKVEEIWERLDTVRDALRPADHGEQHQLFGYPLHSRIPEDPTPADTVTLWVLGSDDHLGWSWCDGEHLTVAVPRASLTDGSFSGAAGFSA